VRFSLDVPAPPIYLLRHARVQQNEANRWLRDVAIDPVAESAMQTRTTKRKRDVGLWLWG
jgi:hypothetical protein